MSLYIRVQHDPPFHIPITYTGYVEDRRALPSGWLGIVKKFDSHDGKPSVVIKKITDPLRSTAHADIVTRELNLLKNTNHENIVRFLGSYSVTDNSEERPETPDKMDAIYHITEYCGPHLSDVINEGKYEMEKVKQWIRELLSALHYLHSIEIVHRDLNPENMCISPTGRNLTLIGFGRARKLELDNDNRMTGNRGDGKYVALEMRLEWIGSYDEKVDMWSVGEILFEMIAGNALFGQRKPIIKQMLEYCGPLDEEVLAKISNEDDREALAKFSATTSRKDLVELLCDKLGENRTIGRYDVLYDDDLRNFFERTLHFNPNSRMSAVNASVHPFLLEQNITKTLQDQGADKMKKGNETNTKEDESLRAYRHHLFNLTNDNSRQDRANTSKVNYASNSGENRSESVEMVQPPIAQKEYVSEFLRMFKPLKILGQGGYGCVFEAERNVEAVTWHRAVKRIPVIGSVEEVNKTLKEVVALILLDHSGIVKFISAWKEQPPHGWQRSSDKSAMDELLRNSEHDIDHFLCDSSLSEWLSKNDQRCLKRMKKWFTQIVSAVSYIHQKGYTHRDLKPSNILIAGTDVLKVCDLGIVANRLMINEDGCNEAPGSHSFNQGSKFYMAPEQKWEKYTSKVDIFALGLILTEMCVVMDRSKAAQVFDNFRAGTDSDVLNHLPELKSFVTWLSNRTDTQRPDCVEILKHPFLSTSEHSGTPTK